MAAVMEKKEHEFCLRCGRKLKNPIARQKGYGMVCEKKIKIANTRKLFEYGGINIDGNDTNLQSS